MAEGHGTHFAERWERLTAAQRRARVIWSVPSLLLIALFIWAVFGDEPGWVSAWLFPLAWLVVLGNLALWVWGRTARTVRAGIEDIR